MGIGVKLVMFFKRMISIQCVLLAVLVADCQKTEAYRRTPQKSTSGAICKVVMLIKRDNSPTQRKMATKLWMSQDYKNELQANL